HPGGPPEEGCPLPALFGPIWGCSVEGVTTFHRRRCRRRSSLWPFYSYSRPHHPAEGGPVSHPSDRSAPPCDGLQLLPRDRRPRKPSLDFPLAPGREPATVRRTSRSDALA